MKTNNKLLWKVTSVNVVKSISNRDLPVMRQLINVYPDFGKKHELTPGCWCHPEVLCGGIISHNVFH